MQKEKLIKSYVSGKIYALTKCKETSVSKATLASLRRGVGKTPGEVPELWGAFLENAPEGLYSDSLHINEPQYEEWAVYIALTLFAVHQQGSSECVNSDTVSLGNAASMLMDSKKDEDRERVLRRFSPVVTANSMEELSHYLRSLVQLFKAKGIKLDYAELACDIYKFQFENSKKQVLLKWARDFYKNTNNNDIKGE